MKNTKKPIKKKQNIVPIFCAVFAVALIAMVVVLCLPGKEPPKGEYVKPAFDSAAVQGIPEVDASLGYWELYQEGMAYRVALCGEPTVDANELTVYFTNSEGNEKYLKLRVLDAKGNTLGETGLLRPGEYVPTVTLSKKVAPGTSLKFKVLGFEPEDYTSAGSVVLNVKVAGTNYTWLWITLALVVLVAAAVTAAVLLQRKKKHPGRKRK